MIKMAYIIQLIDEILLRGYICKVGHAIFFLKCQGWYINYEVGNS